MDRREFIKRAGLLSTGLAATTLPLSAIENALTKIESDDLLDGVCDLHLHCAPDFKQRIVDELTMAKKDVALEYRIGNREHLYPTMNRKA